MADGIAMQETEPGPTWRAAIYNAAPEPIQLLDLHGTITHANEAAQAALCRDGNRLAGRSVLELIAPDQHSAVRDAIRAATSGVSSALTLHVSATDRLSSYWEARFFSLGVSQPDRVAMICRDITAAHHRELAAQGHTRILHALAAGVPTAEILDACCSLAEQLIEGSRATITLHPSPGASHAEPRAELAHFLATTHAPGITGAKMRLIVGTLEDETSRNDHDASTPFQRPFSTQWAIALCVGQDHRGVFCLTFSPPRPAAESELQLGQDCATLATLALGQDQRAMVARTPCLDVAAESVPGFLFVTDANGAPIYVNAYYEKRTGRKAEELLTAGWAEAVHPEDHATFTRLWEAATTAASSLEGRFRIRMADSTYRWHLQRAMPQYDEHGAPTGWVGVAVDIEELIAGRDIIQRYRMELEHLVKERTQALQDTVSELHAETARREQAMAALSHQHKVDALGQLTAGVAHDFNNLLSTIMGGFQLIESRTEDGAVLALTRNGLRASERAASLVRQLLSVARREPPRPEWLDLSVALPGMQDLLRHALHPGIRLVIEVPRTIWPVFVDLPQLESALLNLAVNARDAMPETGKLTISAANRRADGATPDSTADTVVISVADTGSGIPADVLARVCEPFFTTKPRGEGTGLGLAMVKSFAKAAAGDLIVQSTEGAGTIVALHLPRAVSAASVRRESGTGHGVAADQPTALVVDTDEAVRAITSAFLRDASYRVVEASNGAVALALLQVSSHIDVLVTALNMPAMDGLQLVNAVRAARPGLPVVLITGPGHDHDTGGEVAVAKPFGGPSLTRAVALVMGRHDETAPRPDRLLTRMRSGLIREAYMTWQALRGDDSLPGFGALTVAGRAWADHAFLLAVDQQQDPARFRWVSVGQAVARHLAHDPTQPIDDSPRADALLGPLEQIYRGCVADGMPHYQAVEIRIETNRAAAGERLLMPATSDAGGVTHLLGIIDFEQAA